MKCLYCKEAIDNVNELYQLAGDLTGKLVYHEWCYYKMLEENLIELKIRLYDDKGKFRNLTDIMEDLSGVWNDKIIN